MEGTGSNGHTTIILSEHKFIPLITYKARLSLGNKTPSHFRRYMSFALQMGISLSLKSQTLSHVVLCSSFDPLKTYLAYLARVKSCPGVTVKSPEAISYAGTMPNRQQWAQSYIIVKPKLRRIRRWKCLGNSPSIIILFGFSKLDNFSAVFTTCISIQSTDNLIEPGCRGKADLSKERGSLESAF